MRTQSTKQLPVKKVTKPSAKTELRDPRGRKPLMATELRERVRNELSKYVIKMEKEAFRSMPEKNSDVRNHVLQSIKKVVGQ
jgi:hypothetical protein